MAFLDRVKEYRDKVRTSFNKLSQKQKWISGGAAAASFALVFSLVSMSAGDGSLVPIQSPVKDLSAAQAELARYGIDSDFSSGEADLMVDRDKKDRAMLILNAAKLLPDGLSNYKFLGDVDFTSTEPQRYERIRTHIEALLGETIRAMDGIKQAQVRITPATREVTFHPDSQNNKASVTVDLSGQQNLAQGQVLAISSLIASSYPRLSSDDVTVIDTSGRMYSHSKDSIQPANRIQLKHQVEVGYEEKVLRALSGYDAVVAVTLDVQVIDREESSSKDYKPEEDSALHGYKESRKEEKKTETNAGTAGLRAESQNSNRTDPGRKNLSGNEKISETLEQFIYDEDNKKTLKTMNVIIDYTKSSIAIALPDYIADNDAERTEHRTRVSNLVAAATGIDISSIAVEFTPRNQVQIEEGIVSTLFGENGALAQNSSVMGYGVMLVLILGAFWILNGVVKKSAPKPISAAAEMDSDVSEQTGDFSLSGIDGANPSNIEGNMVFEKVLSLIDENPAAAANLVKRWIIFNE